MVLELVEGRFENFHNHASPFFHAFNAVFTSLFGFKVWVVNGLSMFLNILGLGIFSLYFQQIFKWRPAYTLSFWGCLSITFFQWYASYCLAVEHLAVLFAALALLCFEKYSLRKQQNHLWLVGVCLSLSFNASYRSLLLVAFLWLYLVLSVSLKKLNIQDFIQATWIWAVCISLSIVFWSLLGWCFGAKWYGYIANLYGIFALRQAAETASFLHTDTLFYLQYAFNFEFCLLLSLPLLLIQSVWRCVPFYLLFLTISYLVVALILPKAPRALCVVFPILYAFVWAAFILWLEKTTWIAKPLIMTAVIVCFSLYSFWTVQKKLLNYQDTKAYKLIVNELEKHATQPQTVLTSSFSLNILPLLSKKIRLEVCTSDSAWQVAESDFFLRDDYVHFLNKSRFSDAERKLLLSLPCKHLCTPILFLEHCEYTGQTYNEAMQAQKQLEKTGAYLQLYQKK